MLSCSCVCASLKGASLCAQLRRADMEQFDNKRGIYDPLYLAMPLAPRAAPRARLTPEQPVTCVCRVCALWSPVIATACTRGGLVSRTNIHVGYAPCRARPHGAADERRSIGCTRRARPSKPGAVASLWKLHPPSWRATSSVLGRARVVRAGACKGRPCSGSGIWPPVRRTAARVRTRARLAQLEARRASDLHK